MKWNLNELVKYKQEPLRFNEMMDVTAALKDKFNDVILDATPMQVEGMIQNEQDDFVLHAHVVGKIITPSTRSAEPVDLPLDFMIDEIYIPDIQHAEHYEMSESVILLEDEVLNFDDVLVDYIFLQIPLQVLAEGEEEAPMPEGEGWAVISEDEYLAEHEAINEPANENNTPLAGLANLLDHENDEQEEQH
ncbi:hypothetical protein IV73_GL000649 [Weissella kandleri]|uniref:DUF177 domain-containing protein n=1 Tax=Weissella kandleri TaxID=1616 RepID=A0A0R2JDN9_9LACO|nr:DUF177 domain-containing protein [Weissella kandleri]KRN75480.1 hypothetical protein IV73_GL000649 [Weissella kandleri]